MITHMIGDNDFCFRICYTENPYDILEKHRRDLLTVLRIFKKYLPRTLVNIVPPPSEFSEMQLTCINAVHFNVFRRG